MPRITSLRSRLFLLYALALAPLLAILIYSFLVQINHATNQAKTEALGLTKIIAKSYEDLISRGHGALSVLAQLPEVKERDLPACQNLFAEQLEVQKDFAALGAADLNGLIYCVAPSAISTIRIADRPYFQKVLKTEDFVVGEYMIGRASGIPVIPLAQPIYNDQGAMAGVILVTIGLEWLESQAREATLPEGSILTLVDEAGTILARYPDGDKWVGQSLPESHIVRTFIHQGASGTAEGTGLDGQPRIYGITQLIQKGQNSGLVLYISLPTRVVLEQITLLFRNIGLGFLALIGILLLGAGYGTEILVMRPINKIRQTMERVVAGDLSARTQLTVGTDEIGGIASSFDTVVTSLEKREKEKEAAFREQLKSEERYRILFQRIQEGFAIHEIICDGDGSPVDYRFLEINPAFEKNVGLKAENIIGKTVLEVMPMTEKYWIDAYGKVALTGKPIRFDNYSQELNKHFEVVAFSPQKNQFATLLVDVTKLKKAEERVREQLSKLSSLREIDLAIAGSVDLHVVLSIILGEITSKLNVDAASVLLYNERTGYLEFEEGKGFKTPSVEKSKLRLGEGLAGKAALDRELVHVSNLIAPNSNFTRKELVQGEKFVGYWGIPLIAKGNLVGVLEIFTRTPLEPSNDWLSFLNILAGQTAIALDGTLIYEKLLRKNLELSSAYEATLEGWSKALELRDDETHGHTQRVTELTLQLARQIHIGEDELVNWRRGSILHDIGKIGIPDCILLKPGPLSDQEWLIMKRHPQFAYDLLSPISYLKGALDIPYCHHEKWDGSGYPRGLKGKTIPLAARIFSVADVWDALLSDRPYRKAWSVEKAISYLKDQTGKHFDPKVVEVFLQIHLEKT